MPTMLFDGWYGPLRILVVGVAAYLALIVMVRVSGKRTLAKLSAFDLVVTVALGSTLATVTLSKDVSLVEGLIALAMLISLQYLVARATTASSKVEQLVKARPAVVLHHGELDHSALHRERLTQDDVLGAIRAAGVASMSEVDAVVLETDGQLSVIVLRAPGDDALPELGASS